MRFYAVILAAVVFPVLMAFLAHRVEKNEEKLRAIKHLGGQSLKQRLATTNPSDLIRAFQKDNADLERQFKEIDDK